MANALADFSNGLAEAVERAGRSVVAIREGGRQGVSGTVWSSGVLVAAEHTVRGRDEVTVKLPSGEVTSATVAGRDPGTDIAALRAKTATTAPPETANPAELRVGHVVLAVGRRADEGLRASYGIVSGIGGPWRTWSGGRVDRYLRLDLSPYTGFSGGPLIDSQGRVLGINTSGPRRTVLTIPASTVDRVVKQLIDKGRISRGYLGAGFQPVALSGAMRAAAGLQNETALLVVNVVHDGPSDRGGLLVGDIVVDIGGTAMSDVSDLQAALDPDQVGKTVKVKVLRGGVAAELSITIGERPGER